MSEDHVETYYSATARDKRGFPTLHGDISADVAIIGGGFTGIASAVELAERGLSVVVLEANKIGWGATGRNGGQVTGSLSGDTAAVQ
ncbi:MULTISPECIES: NAD(P)/FAD-dependent oxidoreductase [Rhodobacterales]|uniref:NAD(P)/FAD-dependent oxidoreductase n=1 Tax=Rhodobacterales TaxID=204455 RepID=UPI001C68AA06|nr:MULTISPECIES: FAD-binding oxidoreductase [Rhodobacterales]MDO6589757.1 FAD-binding oxidoreductase [Yoonia sp. 1_MG-2023]